MSGGPLGLCLTDMWNRFGRWMTSYHIISRCVIFMIVHKAKSCSKIQEFLKQLSTIQGVCHTSLCFTQIIPMYTWDSSPAVVVYYSIIPKFQSEETVPFIVVSQDVTTSFSSDRPSKRKPLQKKNSHIDLRAHPVQTPKLPSFKTDPPSHPSTATKKKNTFKVQGLPYLYGFLWEWYGNSMGKGSHYWGSLKIPPIHFSKSLLFS